MRKLNEFINEKLKVTIMRNIKKFINEKLKVSKENTPKHTLFPKNREDLIDMIRKKINEEGPECDLNCIDVSAIDNFGGVFSVFGTKQFDGDISNWNMSNAISLTGMFDDSMFSGINGGIEDWDVSNVETMDYIFSGSKFNSDISNWNVEKVKSMVCAFSNCPFEQDIDSWNPKSIEHGGFTKTFYSCALKEKKKLPKWYKAGL